MPVALSSRFGANVIEVFGLLVPPRHGDVGGPAWQWCSDHGPRVCSVGVNSVLSLPGFLKNAFVICDYSLFTIVLYLRLFSGSNPFGLKRITINRMVPMITKRM